MPRHARMVLAGIPHHVLQRGNFRQNIFFTDADYLAYLELLKIFARRSGLDLLGYCLLPNHVHLLAVPRTETALARAVGHTHLRYTQRINLREGQTGHLWQNRFFSCPLDTAYLPTALRYLERNPVRLGLATRAWEYRWSSAAAHTGGLDPAGLIDPASWATRYDARAWRAQLATPEDEDDLMSLRQHTQIGRPLGRDDFIDHLEATLGRRIRPLPVGRPKKIDASPEAE